MQWNKSVIEGKSDEVYNSRIRRMLFFAFVLLARNLLLQSALRPCGMFYCEMLFGGSMNPILNFGINMPLVLVVGLMLNIWVEKPVLKIFADFPAK